MKNKLEIIKGFFCIFKYSTLTGIAILLINIISAIIPIAKTYAYAYFIDQLLLGYDTDNYKKVIIPTILVVGFKLLQYILNYLLTLLNIKSKNNLMIRINPIILEKQAKLKYRYIEDTKALDLISRINKQPEMKFMNCYNNLMDILSVLINIVGIVGILFSYAKKSAVILLLCAIPMMIISVNRGKMLYGVQKVTSMVGRKCQYYLKLLLSRESSEERILFGYANKIKELWSDEFDLSTNKFLDAYRKVQLNTLFYNLLYTFVSCLVMSSLIKYVMSGSITVGLFISIFNSIFSLNKRLVVNLSNYIDILSSNLEFLKDCVEMDSLENDESFLRPNNKEKLTFHTLEFRNVCFKYPNTEREILKGVSFIIESNKHCAFVGANGSGKTTLVKILLGLYDEYTGEILLNGKNIKEYPYEQVRELFSVVFQDFAKYYVTLRENILVGNPDNNSDEDVKNVLEKVYGNNILDKAIFGKGLDTILGRIKSSGKDLSYGQWQMIAIARCYFSDGQLCILDEPTSALDPIMECNVYAQFDNITRDRTTLTISHRLGATKMADKLFVLSDGSIIEQGNHDELMKRRGVYYQMYDSQRSWYE